MATFTVDTHIFRELGELLVGRDSTALVELLKNAYDADATEIQVYAEDLSHPGHGVIVIRDNGLGMTKAQFVDGFLRIASRLKEDGGRRSPRFNRRYTGAKGIGRLAAHKLASQLHIESVAVDPGTLVPTDSIKASINWDLIERSELLENISEGAITLTQEVPSRSAKGGTVITLRLLRKKWTPRESTRFVLEARNTLPPPILTNPLPRNVLREPLLFKMPITTSLDQANLGQDPGWTLDLAGDFDIGEEYWQTVAEAANWVLEIDASSPTTVAFAIAPTERQSRKKAEAQRFITKVDRASRAPLPLFHARILIREGQITGQPETVKRWVQLASGIRVFMEGFRVLPYGEPGNDWLEIDRDYTRRSRELDSISAQLFKTEPNDADAPLNILPNRSYIGGVFLTQEGSAGLRMLINREGFVPDEAYQQLTDIVKSAVNLATRVRAEANFEERNERKLSRRAKATNIDTIFEAIDRSASELDRAALALRAGAADEALSSVKFALESVDSVRAVAEDLRDERALVRALASVGTQMATFIHEVNSLVALSDLILSAIADLRADLDRGDRSLTRRLASLALSIQELRRGLERQASYLTDIVTPDARRRRSRQPIADCFSAALKLFSLRIEQLEIDIENKIPHDLLSPPMFRAELIAIFTNLLSNAIKAAGKNGRIRASSALNDRMIVRLENTGIAVRPKDGERWFLPFASTTPNSDPILGQGMGLGLPITRRILEEYGAAIRFTDPTEGFATAVEMGFQTGA